MCGVKPRTSMVYIIIVVKYSMERFKSSLNHIYSQLTQKWTLLGIVFVVVALSWVAVFASANSGRLEVHFFDVGQGDAIFIEMPDGRQILIDGGPNDKVVEKLNKYMPFWDRSIDIMIATHADADHLTGLVSVLQHYDVDTILWNGVFANTKIFKEWSDAALKEDAEILVGEYGMRFRLSDQVFFEILYPYIASKAGTVPALASQNDYSLVVRFVYGDDSFLFTSDIERQSEYEIISNGVALKSDVLKVPHHGSKTSSSELFLESVEPKVAVIQVGRSNSYGHPHAAVLQRLKKYGIDIRRVDIEGDVTLTSNGNSF